MAPSSITALVVDDDAAFAAKVAEVIAAEGALPETFADARRALTRMSKLPAPAIVFLDLAMPGHLDGWDFYAQLQRHQVVPSTAVVLVSGMDPIAAAPLEDVACFVRKPRAESEWPIFEEQIRRLLSEVMPRPASPTYRLEISSELARIVETLPGGTRNELARELKRVTELPLSSSWTSGDPRPTVTVKADACRALVELDQKGRAARVVAVMLPERGWVGLAL